jgi:hypothetical protein
VPLLTDPHRALAEPGSDPSTEPDVPTVIASIGDP